MEISTVRRNCPTCADDGRASDERKVDIMKNTIKKSLEELERLEAVADVADEAYQNNPESEEVENAFDEAYQAEYNAFIIVSNQIAEFAGIDAKTARAMVQGKREELKQILA